MTKQDTDCACGIGAVSSAQAVRQGLALEGGHASILAAALER